MVLLKVADLCLRSSRKTKEKGLTVGESSCDCYHVYAFSLPNSTFGRKEKPTFQRTCFHPVFNDVFILLMQKFTNIYTNPIISAVICSFSSVCGTSRIFAYF